MQTFIINLERRPDRKREMERQLLVAGISDYEFVKAVDGREGIEDTDRYNAEEATLYNKEHLLPGEVACALSHISIYEHMLVNNLQRCLILEDDVVLPKGFSKTVDIIAREERTCDLVTFNYPPVQVLHAPNWQSYQAKPHLALYYLLKIPYNASLKAYEIVLGMLYQHNPRATWLPRPLYLAGAYLLSSEGAKKLLSHTHPIHYTADTLLNKSRILGPKRLSMKACVPLQVRQNQEQYGSDMDYSAKRLLV